jgi:hypothetical protein
MTKNQKRKLRWKKRILRYSIKHKVGKYANEQIAKDAIREHELGLRCEW